MALREQVLFRRDEGYSWLTQDPQQMMALDDGARDSAVGRWGAGKAGTEDEIPGIVMPGMQPRKNSNAKRSNRSSGSSQRNHAGKSNHQRLLACL